MKTLKFTTSKGDFALMDGAEQIDQTLKALLEEYTPVAKVSDMSEEEFVEVVNIDDDYGITMFQNYATTSMAYFDEQINAEQSFTSLIRSLGWYLWENPVQHSIASLSDQEQAYRQLDTDWQEAESKTLYNPILLKKI